MEYDNEVIKPQLILDLFMAQILQLDEVHRGMIGSHQEMEIVFIYGTNNPISLPTLEPTIYPTYAPTMNRSHSPTAQPTVTPTIVSKEPSGNDNMQVSMTVFLLVIGISVICCMFCVMLGIIYYKRRAKQIGNDKD